MTDTRDELLPCPFCGGRPKVIFYNGTDEATCAGGHECPGTDVLVPIAAWNRRAAMPAVCSDCPPEGYPTDETRCVPCPRRAALAAADAVPAAVPGDVVGLNVIFDGPPGPEAGRFVEVETDDGRSISVGEWIERPNGFWALRFTKLTATATLTALSAQVEALALERNEARAMYHAACDERESLKKIRVAAEARRGELERERDEARAQAQAMSISAFAAINPANWQTMAYTPENCARRYEDTLQEIADKDTFAGTLESIYEHCTKRTNAAEARVAELERLVQDMIDNDPNDMAADTVTVLDVWRKEARAVLTKGDNDASN